MENFAIYELNRASRFKDESKLVTLGPWAKALGMIIGWAQRHRTDLSKYDHNKQQDLYRGGGMTAEEVKEYQKRLGKEGHDRDYNW